MITQRSLCEAEVYYVFFLLLCYMVKICKNTILTFTGAHQLIPKLLYRCEMYRYRHRGLFKHAVRTFRRSVLGSIAADFATQNSFFSICQALRDYRYIIQYCREFRDNLLKMETNIDIYRNVCQILRGFPEISETELFFDSLFQSPP